MGGACCGNKENKEKDLDLKKYHEYDKKKNSSKK